MNPLDWLARPEFAALAEALLHFLWQGTLIALLLAAGKRLWRIERAQERYACSLAALAAMALCPVITYFAVAPLWPAPIEALESSAEFEAGAAAAAAADVSLGIWTQATQPYLLALWLAGVCAFGLRLTAGFVGVWRIQQGRQPLPLELALRVHPLGQRLGVDASARVFLSRHVREALVVGFWRPVVLVPAAWVTEMPLAALEAVIAHELAHLRRMDLWVNLLQRVVETLLFYHPAVWWVSRQLRQEREMCCDELAVEATGARLAYVEALELVARERLAGVRPALAAGIRGESNMKLLARVRNVLGGRGRNPGSWWPAGVVALLLPLAMWAVTWGVLSPNPPAAVADESDDKSRDSDDDERKDGDRPRREAAERKRDGDARGEEQAERKEGHRDGEQPRKEGDRRDGEERKEGPRDGEVRKEGPRDGEPRKEGERKEKPRKEGEVRKDPIKKEARKEQPAGQAPRNKIVREGDAPRKDGEGHDKLEAMIRELRAENEKLRAELRELRSNLAAKLGGGEAGERDELIKRFGGEGERKLLAEKRDKVAAEERVAVEAKLRALAERKEHAAREAAEAKERAANKQREAAEQKERAVREAAEQRERAAIKEREAAERKEREIERRRDEERAREDK